MAKSWKGDTETNICSELQESAKSDRKNGEMVRSEEKTVRADSDNGNFKNFYKGCQIIEEDTHKPQTSRTKP